MRVMWMLGQVVTNTVLYALEVAIGYVFGWLLGLVIGVQIELFFEKLGITGLSPAELAAVLTFMGLMLFRSPTVKLDD